MEVAIEPPRRTRSLFSSSLLLSLFTARIMTYG